MSKIYCMACIKDVTAILTDGSEIYPHRSDLHSLPFWKCGKCKGYVGCHHKTKDRTRPLGNIPTKELRNARKHIHAILDPLWKGGVYKRGDIYSVLSNELGWRYHTAEIQSVKEARKVYKIVQRLRNKHE